MPTATIEKTKKKPLKGSQFFQLVADKVGIKNTVVRDVVHALAEVSVDLLKENKEVRIPHLGKIVVKDVPSKVREAGNYPNPFKGGQVEWRERKVVPAKRKFKMQFASQIKKPLAL